MAMICRFELSLGPVGSDGALFVHVVGHKYPHTTKYRYMCI